MDAAFSAEQVFLVTGASSGIGRGVAQSLVENGASVVGIARNPERLAQTKAGCAAPERFFAEERDLAADIAGLPSYVKSLKDKYGKFRGLAYCAGVLEMNPLQTLDLGAMKRVYDIDYFAPVFMAKGFADRRINTGRGASLVFISSVANFRCNPSMTTYAGAKAALSASAKCMARELAPSGVRVNVVSPSVIKTEALENIAGVYDKEAQANGFPLGFGEVADVASIVCYLLSENAKWITGQNYIVDCASL